MWNKTLDTLSLSGPLQSVLIVPKHQDGCQYISNSETTNYLDLNYIDHYCLPWFNIVRNKKYVIHVCIIINVH